MDDKKVVPLRGRHKPRGPGRGSNPNSHTITPGTPERMAEIRPVAGKGRLKPPTAAEVKQHGFEPLSELFTNARASAIAKLAAQIDHKDAGIAQRAAIRILEITDGKPTQTIVQHTDGITRVVYETAALVADEFTPGYGLDADQA